MRRFSLTLTVAFTLLAAADAHADGFFRRVPVVGEWASYDLQMTYSDNMKLGEDEPKPDDQAVTGTLTLKCVGEETIEEVPHLWLEVRFDIVEPDGKEPWMVVKVLVPTEEVVGENLSDHIVRGWSARDDAEAYEIDLDANGFDEDPSMFARMLVFPAYDGSVGRRESRILTIDGEEVQLNHNESGTLLVLDTSEGQISGEATWWPSESHAFGIAAAELRWDMNAEPIAIQIEMTMQMDLMETGTDAVSDLPDHN